MAEAVLVINPGSTSWKLGVYSRSSELAQVKVEHHDLSADEIVLLLGTAIDDNDLVAVAARGGLLRPLPGGVYRINQVMVNELSKNQHGKHASNLGAPIAAQIALKMDIPAYIVDPVTADEFDPVAEISGLPGIKRICRGHMLNIRAVVRQACHEQNLEFENSRWVVAHLGGGISVAAVADGKIVDINDALLGQGPFSPQRAGSLPLRGILDLAYKHPREQVEQILSKKCGLMGYLGTDDLEIIEKRISAGDEEAALVMDAMLYQISKEIGSMAAALGSRFDGLILTGGLANSQRIVSGITGRFSNFPAVLLYPGSLEMEALAQGAWRVLDGIEIEKTYG